MLKYMVAVERFISTNGPAIRAAGFVTRDLAHYHGVPHTSVLVVPVRVTEPGRMEILVRRRPPGKKVSPDTWDTFGGHVDGSIQEGRLVPPADALRDPTVLHKFIDETAIREANEEIKIRNFAFSHADVHRFGGYGDFECGTDDPGADNVEYSTVFVAVLPTVTGAVKLNYEVHGNTIPHLHMHFYPRYPGDPFEGGPINPKAARKPYAPGEITDIRRRLLEALVRAV